MDILKQLNLLVGLSRNEVRFGVPDDTIFKYAQSLECKNKEIEEDQNIIKLFNSIISDFKANNDIEHNHKKNFSVFSIKLFFLSHLFQNDCFQNKNIIEKRDIILKIIEFTSLFSSNDLSKKNSIPKEIFDSAQEVWKIGKTTHNKKELEVIFKNHFYEIVQYILNNNFINKVN